MFHIHKWDKWQPASQKYVTVLDGKEYFHYKEFQRRTCAKCGKAQIERL